MSNHVHYILSSEGELLPNIIRDHKKYTSKEIVKAINTPMESRREWMMKQFEYNAIWHKHKGDYMFWQEGYRPIELFSNQLMDQKLKYIHENPVKAGIVLKPEDYNFSSARTYAGESGFIPIDYLE